LGGLTAPRRREPPLRLFSDPGSVDAVLERIALHQTRLHTPGLSLDANGIALGSKGVVLLPSIDRLAGFLAVYTRERSLEDLLPSLAIRVVRSAVGAHEITFEAAAESSDRMDRLAETARLVGGLTFTGTARHFVRYRDSAAPFGYDARELIASGASFALYHEASSQAYDVLRDVDLRDLLLRLMPRPDRSTASAGGPRVLVAEDGLGPALAHYLFRSEVAGEVGVAEWPPASPLDDAPIRRWIFRVADPPPRMQRLLQSTPGLTAFVPAAPGVAVEVGYRHPVELRACPVFPPEGLVLLRGGRPDGMTEPWRVERVPAMAEIGALAHVDWAPAGSGAHAGRAAPEPDEVRVRLRLAPSSRPWRSVTASCVAPEQLALLRRLAYSLPHATIARTEIALTPRGAILRSAEGIDGIPVGLFFFEAHPQLYIPAGYEVSPAVGPDVLARAIGAAPSQLVFVSHNEETFAIERSAFSPLEAALLAAPPWDALAAQGIEAALDEVPIELAVTSIGMIPLRGVKPPPER
jgi:hypothetical protein